jgi:hypothetical protein
MICIVLSKKLIENLDREVFMKSVYPDYQRLMESWIIVGVAAPARMPVKLKNQKTIKNHKNQKTKKPFFLKNHWFLPALSRTQGATVPQIWSSVLAPGFFQVSHRNNNGKT